MDTPAPEPKRSAVWRHIPQRCLGARLRIAADGRLIGDDPCAAACLSGCRPRRDRTDRRDHRGRGGGDGLDHEGLFRCAERPTRQAKAARGLRLWPRGIHQARLPPGLACILAGRRALHRPVGKGIRGAPRDALVADISPPHLRGASFGFWQSLDTVGAFLGPDLSLNGDAYLATQHGRSRRMQPLQCSLLPARRERHSLRSRASIQEQGRTREAASSPEPQEPIDVRESWTSSDDAARSGSRGLRRRNPSFRRRAVRSTWRVRIIDRQTAIRMSLQATRAA